MLRFKQFISEEFLTEILNSEFDVTHHKDLKDAVNNGNAKGKVYPAHTAVMTSEHMRKHDLAVLRMKNKNQEVEYHLLNFTGVVGDLPPEKRNTKALLHCLKIIKDDSKSYIERGSKIKLQSATKEQHENYKKLASNILKQFPEKSIKDVGEQDRTDGTGKSKTLMIEEVGFNPINWVKDLGLVLSENTSEEKHADEMFDPESIENNRHVGWKSRTKLVKMKIDDFLDSARKLQPKELEHSKEVKEKGVEEYLSRGEKIKQIPRLDISGTNDEDNQVSGHEGRHRAMALKRRGYTHMPVLVSHSNFRWDQQKNPDAFDYREKWPKTMKNEDGDKVINFPVEQKHAGKSYE